MQRHILNDIEIIDRRTEKYIKLPYTALTSSKSSSDYIMVKTIFNKLKNDVEILVKSLCETQSNTTNDIIIIKCV